jgi:hypothetical protein
MRHRTDAEEPPIELFAEDVDRDIARLHKSRHDGTLDWDQYLEVLALPLSSHPFNRVAGSERQVSHTLGCSGIRFGRSKGSGEHAAADRTWPVRVLC